MYLVKTPFFIKSLFSDYIWDIDTHQKEVFITFDDGPIPELTPWILDVFKEYDFQATFFCVGDNILKYPDIYTRIVEEGHAVGNHTFNHLNGWHTDNDTYMENVKAFDELLATDFFRPPYGKLKRGQASAIKSGKKIVMWDVLSGDFDAGITREQCLKNVLENFQQGSIIVFHDNIKAEEKLRFVLPKFLKHLNDLGYRSSAIHSQVPEYA
jgi:peptidoglycan/xylan/chitin deacetylase (PgdA/CDA1 family)